MQNIPKHWLSSVTIRRASIAFFGGLSFLVSNPDFYRKTADYAQEIGQDKVAKSLRNYVIPIVVMLASTGVITQRTKRKDIYTEHGLPGPNKENLIAIADQEALAQNDQLNTLTRRAELAEQGQAVALRAVADVLGQIPNAISLPVGLVRKSQEKLGAKPDEVI